jgi:hypothetical protein
MDEGARGAPRAVNTHIISQAIDILSPYHERGEPFPAKLSAVSMGVDGVTADGGPGIILEVLG